MLKKKKNKKIICGTILYNDDKKFLLQLRDNNKQIDLPNKWVFPGGHKDNEENLEDCAKRELYEETNFKAKKINYLGTINLFKESKIIHYYYCKFDSKQIIQCHEGQMLKFFKYEDIFKLNTPVYTLKILKKFILKIF